MTSIPPPDFWRSPIPSPTNRGVNQAALAIGAGVFFILAVFQPFGTYTFRSAAKFVLLGGYGALIVGVVALAWRILSDHWPAYVAAWTPRREMVVFGWILWLAVSATYVYQRLALGGRWSWWGYCVYLGVALSTSLLPLALILVVRYHYLQQWRLRQTVAAPPPVLTLTGDNRDEQITVQRSHLLYLKGADNYVEVFVQKGATVERHVLRGALTRLLAQVNDPALVQVHRSFVVNFAHPFRLAGQSPNYVLHLGETLEPIPVSRQKLADVRRLLREKPL